MYGYVAIYRETIWGTIKKGNVETEEAKVLCKTGKYKSGVYDNGKYCTGNMKRDSMKCWFAFINCQGHETNVDECKTFRGDPWNHNEDLGVKCYF